MEFEEAHYWFTVFQKRCTSCFSDELGAGWENFYKPKRVIESTEEKEQWCGVGRRELT